MSHVSLTRAYDLETLDHFYAAVDLEPLAQRGKNIYVGDPTVWKATHELSLSCSWKQVWPQASILKRTHMPLICAVVALFSHLLVAGSKQAKPYSLCCTLALAAVELAQPLLSPAQLFPQSFGRPAGCSFQSLLIQPVVFLYSVARTSSDSSSPHCCWVPECCVGR